MASIGELALKLSAHPAAFLAGMDKAAQELKKFGTAAGNLASLPLKLPTQALALPSSAILGFLNPIRQGIQNAQGAITKPLDGVLGTIKDVVSAIPFIGGALGAIPGSAGGFIAFIRSSMQEISALGREAAQFGIDVGSFSTLMSAAGPASEALRTGMSHLARELGDVRVGSQEVADKFNRLGLDGMELANMPLDQALRPIADRFAELTNPADKARTALQLFGRHAGMELVPLLSKGAAGIDDLKAKMSKMGLGIDATQLAQVTAANTALLDIEKSAVALGRQLAVGLSPYIKDAATWFTKLVDDAGGVGPILESGFDLASKGAENFLGYVDQMVDEITALKKEWGGFFDIAGKVLSATKTGAEGGSSAVLSGLPGVSAFKAGLGLAGVMKDAIPSPPKPEEGQGSHMAEDFAKRYGRQSEEMRGLLKAGAAAARAFAGDAEGAASATSELQGLAAQLNRSLEQQASTFGMTSHEVEIFKLKMQAARAGQTEFVQGAIKMAEEMAGQLKTLDKVFSVPTASLNSLGEYQQRLARLQDALNMGKIDRIGFDQGKLKATENMLSGLASKAAEVFKQTSTPLEQYQAKIEEVTELMKRGPLEGGISMQTYQRAIGQAVQELERANSISAIAAPTAAIAGTGAEVSARSKFERGGIDANRDPNVLLKQLADNDQKKLALWAKISDQIGALGEGGVTLIPGGL